MAWRHSQNDFLHQIYPYLFHSPPESYYDPQTEDQARGAGKSNDPKQALIERAISDVHTVHAEVRCHK